jgi:hypothetical protein
MGGTNTLYLPEALAGSFLTGPESGLESPEYSVLPEFRRVAATVGVNERSVRKQLAVTTLATASLPSRYEGSSWIYHAMEVVTTVRVLLLIAVTAAILAVMDVSRGDVIVAIALGIFSILVAGMACARHWNDADLAG